MMKRYLVTDHGVKTDYPGLQTSEFQTVLDLCKLNGGIVVVPKGKFYIGGVRMWSDTTLYLEEGAEIYGSEKCEDYEIFEIPESVNMRSDMELIRQYYKREPWETYRRAMISIYGEKNVSIIGEKDSVIDGSNCYDPDGEEQYRGPHAIFITSCENVHLEGYIARNSGNFLHEANNCKNLTMRHVTCLGGSDGIHMHFTQNALIEECVFKTGDDCIAGINIKNLRVNRCVLNTSRNLFRIGGINILVENCYAYGPGYYPHRRTIVRGKNDYLPREEGRHNTLYVVEYFASVNYPYPASDIHFRNCMIENAEKVLHYEADQRFLHSGTRLGEITFENVRFTELLEASAPMAPAEEPLTIRLKNVSYSYREGVAASALFEVSEESNTAIVAE